MRSTFESDFIIEPVIGEILLIEDSRREYTVVAVDTVEWYPDDRTVTFTDDHGTRVVHHVGRFRVTLEPVPLQERTH